MLRICLQRKHLPPRNAARSSSLPTTLAIAQLPQPALVLKKRKMVGASQAIYVTVINLFKKNRDGLHVGDIVKKVGEELEDTYIIGRQAVIKAIRRLESSAMVEWFKGFIKPTTEFFTNETAEYIERFLSRVKPRRRQFVS